jgi:hypothetical protein
MIMLIAVQYYSISCNVAVWLSTILKLYNLFSYSHRCCRTPLSTARASRRGGSTASAAGPYRTIYTIYTICSFYTTDIKICINTFYLLYINICREPDEGERDKLNELPTEEEREGGVTVARSLASQAIMHTTMGDITIKLFPDEVRVHVCT